MKSCARPVRFRSTRKSGFTLTEILIATALTLLMMAVAVNGFGLMAGSIADNRAVIEVSGRLRSAQQRLQLDLRYITVRPNPPVDPKDDQGYLEIIEGPGPWQPEFGVGAQPIKADGTFDSSVGDVDDVIMFTTRSHGEPFVGRWQNTSVQSQVAEVAWFIRGNKLYRRQLLVLPNRGTIALPESENYFLNNDVSVRREGGQADPRTGWESRPQKLTANTLGDLTKRENRFAHQPLQFPHDARFWGVLGLPIMQETTASNFPLPGLSDTTPMREWINFSGVPVSVPATRDMWVAPLAGLPVHQINGNLNAYDGTRVGEDVILTNVIGFDVKVWDPGAPVFWLESTNEPVLPGDFAYKHKLNSGTTISNGAFVDLFYTRGTSAPNNLSAFSGPGTGKSQLQAGANTPAVYCTWSTHYETDGIDTDGDSAIDEGSNGIDDDNQNGVDDPGEYETLPPYPVPLKAIQIKIRVFEPDSGQIREVTVVQDFVR